MRLFLAWRRFILRVKQASLLPKRPLFFNMPANTVIHAGLMRAVPGMRVVQQGMYGRVHLPRGVQEGIYPGYTGRHIHPGREGGSLPCRIPSLLGGWEALFRA